MRKLFFLLLFAAAAHGQNVRWDSSATTTSGTGQMLPVLAIPNASVQFFACSGLSCPTLATTYPSSTSTTPCPSGAQVVWQPPLAAGCVGTADSQGNFGGWFQLGLYQYFVTVNGVTSGPYWFTVGSGGAASSLGLAGGTLYGALYAPNINGEIYPAACGRSPVPTWCSGTTADAWIRAACTQLPAAGGIINLLGLTGTIAASVPCSTPTKQVTLLQDPTSTLTITEADGGVVFPQDNGSMFLGPAVGQGATSFEGIHLSSSANVTAIVAPAHTDGSQESWTASGLILFGASGATVTQGLIYTKNTFANTTIQGNNLFICNTTCIKSVNGGAQILNNWADVSAGVNTIVGLPLIIQGAGNGTGCNGGGTVIGGQYEHALGGGPEITVDGDGAGALACSVTISHVGIERNSAGTASTIGIKIQDCSDCTVEDVHSTGAAGGSDLINVSSSLPNLTQNVTLENISNVFQTYPNTVNDTTLGGLVLTAFAAPHVTVYYADPGYVQPPVLAGNAIQSLGLDDLGGQGSFVSGTANFGTNFGQTGCNVTGLTCVYTRTNSTAPPGSTYSQEVQITSNTYGGSGFNGIQYGTPFAFTAGFSYVAQFWAKGDGAFTGLPTFLLWNSVTGVTACLVSSVNPFPPVWTFYSLPCKPTTSGTLSLSLTALTPISKTGAFYFGGFTFSQVIPLTTGDTLAAGSPFGIGPTPGLLFSAAGTALPTCNSGLKGNQKTVSDATSPTYMGTYTSGGAVTAAVICSGSSWLTH